jgi:hypothetical protein
MGIRLVIHRRSGGAKAVVLAVLAIGLCQVASAQSIAAQDAPQRRTANGSPATSSNPPTDASLNSEQLLVRRRAQRLGKLTPPPAPPRVDAPTFNPIDAFVVARWGKAPADPEPKLCDEPTFLRRVYLDVIGVIPSWKEANRFLAGRDDQAHREKLVDALLARSAQYAAHWTVFWEDALASQNVLAQGGILTRGDYRQWLLASFEQNRPFDVMVAELIDPTMPRRKRPDSKEVLGTTFSIEYVRNENHTVTLQTAANIGQVFLGTGMKCASCHDHFENDEWPQDRFLAFAGLFAPRDIERIRCELKSGQTVPARFPFDVPGASTEVPRELSALLHTAAQLITDPANPRFAKTIVNRLWKRYLGWGLFEPVDDFRLDTPPSHPELLEWLSYDFLAHGCDLKHTTRLILTSRTYQLRYNPQLEDQFSAGLPNAPRYFRSPALRRLTAEQFLDSVRMAASGKLAPSERCFLDARSTALARALGRPASRNEISTLRSDDVAVVQSLELLNGQELHEIVYTGTALADVAARWDARRLVDRLYRATLSRPSTVAERRLGRAYLQASESPAEGLRDMLWALVCSPEFQYIK